MVRTKWFMSHFKPIQTRKLLSEFRTNLFIFVLPYHGYWTWFNVMVTGQDAHAKRQKEIRDLMKKRREKAVLVDRISRLARTTLLELTYREAQNKLNRFFLLKPKNCLLTNFFYFLCGQCTI